MSRRPSAAFDRWGAAIEGLARIANSDMPTPAARMPARYAELFSAVIQSPPVPAWKFDNFRQLLLETSEDDFRPIARALCDMVAYVIAAKSTSAAYEALAKGGRSAAKERPQNPKNQLRSGMRALEDHERRTGDRLSPRTPASVRRLRAARIGLSDRQLLRLLQKRQRAAVTSR